MSVLTLFVVQRGTLNKQMSGSENIYCQVG